MRKAMPHDRFNVVMHEPRSKQFAEQKSGAADAVEVVDIRFAIGVQPREQRCNARQRINILPRQFTARRACNRDPMHGVVGRAAGGEQRDNGVHQYFFVDPFAKAARLLGQGGHASTRSLGQQRTTRIVRLHKRGTGNHQPHRFEQHLIAVRRAIKRTRALGVICGHFSFKQRGRLYFSLRVQLADVAFFLV